MKSLDFGRYALSSCVAASLLAGCGGSQPPIGALRAMRQSRAIASHANSGGSWMLPEATKKPLIYISAHNSPLVYVYTYQGHKVGELNIGMPQGECVDRAGDVWITDTSASEIVEYAHAGTTPIATLEDPGQQPSGCSVDPTTGNLAVTNICNAKSCGNGNVAIYAGAQGLPTTYSGATISHYYFCAYDDRGNLLVNGVANGKPNKLLYAELYKGAQNLTSITLPRGIKYWQSLQGVGKYYAIVGFKKRTCIVSHISIAGSRGKLIGSTVLERASPIDFFVERNEILTLGIVGIVSFWHYPSGQHIRYFLTRFVQLPTFLVVSRS